MNKFKYFIYFARYTMLKSIQNRFISQQLSCSDANNVAKLLLTFSIPFYNKKIKKTNNMNEIIKNIDELIQHRKFEEACEMLKKLKDEKNVEILWRLAQTLYRISESVDIDKVQVKIILEEANEVIDEALLINEECAVAHKWKAIILDQLLRNKGILFKVSGLNMLRHHLERAVTLDSEDVTCLYLLGMWHYQLSFLSKFQRGLLNFFSINPIEPSFEQALNYFEAIEKLRPRKYVCNTYMLGKLNYELNRYYHARYYLKIAASMDAWDEFELKYVRLAKTLGNKLKDFEYFENNPLKDLD